MRPFSVVLSGALLLSAGCAASPIAPSVRPVVQPAAAAEPPCEPVAHRLDLGPWSTELARDHVLVGKAYSVHDARLISVEQLRQAVQESTLLLLGERHDHPDHHRLQALFLSWLVGAGRHPALTLEMLDVRDQPRVDAYLSEHPKDASGLGQAVAWEERGWPSWQLYAPIVQTALDAGLPIVAGNLTRHEVMDLAQHPDRAASLGLQLPLLPDDQVQAMMTELFEAHCRHVPREHMKGMALAQIARDAMLARSMLGAAAAEGAVLIAGNGHVRNDRGVPLHLRLAHAHGNIVAVGMLEVQPGLDAPSDYAEPEGTVPFDFVVFTPRLNDDDPCERFRKTSSRR